MCDSCWAERPAQSSELSGSSLFEGFAGGFDIGGADVLDELCVGVRQRGYPVELAGAGDLLLEVEHALQSLFVGVEGDSAGALRGLDHAFIHFFDTFDALFDGGGVELRWRFAGHNGELLYDRGGVLVFADSCGYRFSGASYLAGSWSGTDAFQG